MSTTKQIGVPKLVSTNYVLLSLVNLVTTFAYSMVSTVISSYAITLGANLTVAGTMAGVFSLAALGSRPVSGAVVDSFSKKRICTLASALITLSFAGYALSSNIPMMMFFRILHGIAFALSSTSNMVLVSEYIPKERMTEGLGYYGIGQIFAQICGPNIGISLKDRFGYTALFSITAIFTVLAVVLILLVKEPENAALQPGEKHTFSLRRLVAKECLAYALVGGLFSLGNGIVSAFLVPMGSERAIPHIAFFFTINALVMLCMRFTLGKILDRISLTWIVNLSLFVTGLSMLLLGNGSGLPIILLAAVLKALGQGGGQISLQSACIKKVDAFRVGIATSTYYIGADIGQGLGPMIGGRLSDLWGYRVMFYWMAGLMVCGILLYNIYEWRGKKGVLSAAESDKNSLR